MQTKSSKDNTGTAIIHPDKLVVGKLVSWTIQYRIGKHTIEQGGDIYIRPYGNPLVRPLAQTEIPYEENYITVNAPPNVKIRLVCNDWLIVTATVVKGRLVEGDEITFTYGDTQEGSPGFRLQSVAHDLRFRMSIKVNSNVEPLALPERPMLHLIPDKPAKFQVKASSILAEDEDIEVLVRCTDQFGNTVEKCDTSLQIPPIPGLTMPNMVIPDLNGEGYTLVRCRRTGKLPEKRIRIAVCDRNGQIVARSNPIEANAKEGEDRIFWGDLHCHSNLEQGLESLEFLYKYARDQEKLDFLGHVEHCSAAKTRWTGKHYKTWKGGMPSVEAYNKDQWEYRKEMVNKYYESGRFVTLLAEEWASNLYGHENVFFSETEGPLLYPSSAFGVRDP